MARPRFYKTERGASARKSHIERTSVWLVTCDLAILPYQHPRTGAIGYCVALVDKITRQLVARCS